MKSRLTSLKKGDVHTLGAEETAYVSEWTEADWYEERFLTMPTERGLGRLLEIIKAFGGVATLDRDYHEPLHEGDVITVLEVSETPQLFDNCDDDERYVEKRVFVGTTATVLTRLGTRTIVHRVIGRWDEWVLTLDPTMPSEPPSREV